MIHHIILYKLRSDVDETRREEMVRRTRSLLLKIPEILSVNSGRNVDLESEWSFYVALEVDNLDRLTMVKEDGRFLRFHREVIEPNTETEEVFSFETDPSKDLRYS